MSHLRLHSRESADLSFSIIEGTKDSLERLGLDYVDVIFAHRPDVSGMVFHVR